MSELTCKLDDVEDEPEFDVPLVEEVPLFVVVLESFPLLVNVSVIFNVSLRSGLYLNEYE